MAAKRPEDTRILLVDDEPDFRNALAFSFKRLGYQVLFASNGKEAFDLIQKDAVDVIISDVQMPGGGGVELLDRTRESHAGMPIILLVTGFSDLSAEDAHHKGAEALFSKPLDRKDLTATVLKLLVPSEERWTRTADRLEVELSVRIEFQGLNQAMDAKVVSLGRGGMFVTLSQDTYPNVGDEIGFKITYDGTGRAMSGNGVIRWIRTKDAPGFPSGFGIEFTYLSDEDRQQVVEYINSKRLKAYIPKH